jgi:LmbE family N-acetylglucosaminyl deacetylase
MTRIVAFFAHPDDETMLAGGILAHLAQAGVEVHYVCATRGEGGETGEPPVCEIPELGDVREQELVKAVGALGGRSLTFLGHVDPRVGSDDELFAFTEDITRLAGQVAASIRQFEAQALVTHGSNGEYGHPAHVLCHQAGLAAALSFEDNAPHLYTFSAMFDDHPYPRLANADDPADWIVEIEDQALEAKTKAALAHVSQNALFVRRPSEKSGRQLSVADVMLRREGLRRILPDGPVQADEVIGPYLTQN